jgi:hypothetical protein
MTALAINPVSRNVATTFFIMYFPFTLMEENSFEILGATKATQPPRTPEVARPAPQAGSGRRTDPTHTEIRGMRRLLGSGKGDLSTQSHNRTATENLRDAFVSRKRDMSEAQTME